MKDKISRRNFLTKTATGSAAGLLVPSSFFYAAPQSQATETARPKVLFFDVNETLLDLSAMKASVGKALNGKTELLPLWFTTMLQYSLVSTVGKQYHDFGAVGAAALVMVGKNNGITLTEAQAKEAIMPILSLPTHVDVRASLMRLKENGYKMVSFTNSSSKAVATQLENAKIAHLFDAQLSIEEIGKFKPHADAYSWAARKMGVQPQEAMLVAAHGWDIAGAQWAGWRTAFLSRPGQQLYPLAAPPEFTAPHLGKLSDILVKL